MVNRLIKTEEDYNAALDRIEQLMDAKPGTEEMDELELLTALVEMYEDKHYPIHRPDPVEAIKFRMEQLGLSQKDMVPSIGSKSRVSEVLNRKRPLTLAMMRALRKKLGISAEVLLQEPGENFPDTLPQVDWSRFPLKEMAKRSWIPNVVDLKERAEEVIRDFIEKAGGMDAVPLPAFRRGINGRFNEKTDFYALNAWCLRVIALAKQNPLKTRYNKGTVDLNFLREIGKLSYLETGPLLAKEYLEKNGIHLIFQSHLPKTYLDGAAMLLPDGNPAIGMTLRYDRVDNFWFCLLHELAHVSRHLSPSQSFIIDDLDLDKQREQEDLIEKEANEMATEALLPEKVWKNHPARKNPTASKVVELAEKLRIHPVIVAGRIRFEKNNYKLLAKYTGRGQVRRLFVEVQESPTKRMV
ncbi:putative transcription regulator with HTH domain [uncultured Desulfobacterium sp.]|uniref:Putative transcription regulator with HTH domain n=1 Tax=uncultured Desulfobacterium sp. TaxID=201089 RepID=A0A445MTA8_9BACT|nr:putative transcription regulator with HTH domain [uncultured Desulfobacterium sp.]